MAAMVRAQSRWVVTGTPIGSGGLTDLHGLLRVLQHDPFQDRQLWQACIARPYARGAPVLHSTWNLTCRRRGKAPEPATVDHSMQTLQLHNGASS